MSQIPVIEYTSNSITIPFGHEHKLDNCSEWFDANGLCFIDTLVYYPKKHVLITERISKTEFNKNLYFYKDMIINYSGRDYCEDNKYMILVKKESTVERVNMTKNTPKIVRNSNG